MNPAWLEDASGYKGHADAVYSPSSEAELAEIAAQSRRGGVPLTVAGAGTGVTGARVPRGGWVVSLERFTRLDVGSGRAIVGAGVLLRDLQAAAARTAQFYAPDPTENAASVGGTIATNASGSRSFRYGATRRHVLAIRVVLPDGRVSELERGVPPDFPFEPLPAPATTKNTAGLYLRDGMDALDVFIGSEGTLGIITEATVALLPAPRQLLSGVVFFPAAESSLAAVDAWRPNERLRMLEWADRNSVDLLRSRYPEIPAPAAAAVLIEQEIQTDTEVDAWIDRLDDAGALADESWFGAGVADRERFRRFRHALPEAVNDTVRRRGLLKMGTDYAVPLPRNREMISRYYERLEPHFAGRYTVYGHIGDAHVHANVLPRDGEEAARAQELVYALAGDAVALGGTVSAEHGLGKRKAHLLALQYTPEQIERMHAVKRWFDPEYLLGRGTLLTPPR